MNTLSEKIQRLPFQEKTDVIVLAVKNPVLDYAEDYLHHGNSFSFPKDAGVDSIIDAVYGELIICTARNVRKLK